MMRHLSHPLHYHHLLAIGLAFFAFFMSALVSRTVFERLPHLEDEMAYLFQAKIFERGQLVVDTPDPRRAYWQPFVVDYEPTGKRFHLWNVTSSEEVWVLNHDGEVIDVFFSPDSVRLAVGVGDKQIQLWDIRSGQKLSLLNHIGPIRSVAFSSDGKYLAIGSQNRMATVWGVQSGEKLLTLSGHANAIGAVTFSPDGARLATASNDGTARLHILEPNELREVAYSRLSRWWTPEECQQYLHQAECPPDLRPKNTN